MHVPLWSKTDTVPKKAFSFSAFIVKASLECYLGHFANGTLLWNMDGIAIKRREVQSIQLRLGVRLKVKSGQMPTLGSKIVLLRLECYFYFFIFGKS